MSLADIFQNKYGEQAEQEKVASEIEQQLEGFTDDEVQRLDAAGHLLDTYGMEFEDGHAKLAAAADLLDALEQDEEATPEGDGDAEENNDNLVQDEDGNVFQYLGNVNDAEGEGSEDEKTAAEHDAAGRIMARAFSDEMAKLNK